MTLVYPKDEATLQADLRLGKARTHVLVIGVGRYPHLQNGAGPPADNVPPLGQLTSPPVSARRFAAWFTGGTMQNQAAPLGSVELLLSDAIDQRFDPGPAALAAPAGPAGTPSVVVEAATLGNIGDAFMRWAERCDSNDNNVAIFYFCGHGLQKINMFLLPEDFGSQRWMPWRTSIDFDQTYNSMAECRAKTQVYVIDACRQVSATMLDESTVDGTTLRRSFATAEKPPRTAPKLYATAEGLPAFGDSGKVSRFTTAVLAALSGGAAKKLNGKWSVSTATLRDAVRRIVQAENESLPTDAQQYVATDGQEVSSTVLHTLKSGEVPNVLVNLRCEPDTATSAARLVISGRNAAKFVREPADGRWMREIPAGVYSLYAEFGAGYTTPQPYPEEWVDPPIFPFELTVQAVP